MRSRLTLQFQDDNDGTGELFAEVEHGKFTGAGSAWFGVEELQAFGQALQDRFPLQADSPLTLQGGFWANSGETKLDQIHVSLSVYPVGSTGTVGVKVELATQVHSNMRPDSQCSVTVELQTNYEPLRTFGREIVAIAGSNAERATLLANDA
jgi:hypothetical protein